MKRQRVKTYLIGARAALMILLANLMSGPVSGQIFTGVISGTVTDPSDAAIADARVQLTFEVRRGLVLITTSDSSGRFTFTGLEPGRYTLRITKAGFVTRELQSIILQAGERLALGTLGLTLGPVTEVVSVRADAAIVKTESADRGGNISSEQVNNLLLIGRNLTGLIGLLPGISEAPQSDTLNRGGGGFRALGSRANTNNVSVDGIQSTDIDNGVSLKLHTSQDAVAEVTVLLSNYQAEHGEGSGAVVRMATKSGSQQFHGLFSYFKKHEQFNANNFFSNQIGLRKPRTRTNTWTYSIGGPIWLGSWNRNRDKLFFFWNQEFWPHKAGDSRTLTVPTVAERNGDFSETLDTNNRLIVILDPMSNRTPFPANRIPPNRMDGNGQALLKVFPEPNFFDRRISRGAYNYVFNAQYGQPNRLETLRVDYNLNSNNQFYGTYTTFNERSEGLTGVSGAFMPNWPLYNVRFWAGTKGVATRWTRIVSATTVNELGFTWQGNPEWATAIDDTWRFALRETWGFRTGMLSTKGNPDGLLPRVNFGGVPNAARIGITDLYEWLPMDNPSNVYTVTQNLSVVRQRHLIKAGIRIQRFWRDIAGPSRRFGSFEFGPSPLNPLDSNYAYSNLLLGVYQAYEESNASPRHFARGGRYDWFIQDTWKATGRLTLDYGVRFSYLIPSYMKDDAWAAFQPSRYDRSEEVQLLQPGWDAKGRRVAIHPVTRQTYSQALIGAIAPGTGRPFNGMVSPSLDRSVQRGVYKSRGVHLGPRFGFAWDVFGNGSTAIRGGGGLFYNPLVIANFRGLTTQPPLIQTPMLLFGELSQLGAGTAFLFPGNVRGTNFSGEVPTAINYSVGVERKVAFGTIVDVSYVASLGRHLSWTRNLNSIPFGANFVAANQDPTTGRPLPSSLLRPFRGYADIDFQEMAGTSDYHSLQVSATRRFAAGLQFGLAYTWSRAREYNGADLERVSTLVPIREWNWGLATFDQTHTMKLNWLWQVPRLRWRNVLARAVLDQWQVSGIASFVSGRPVAATFTTTLPIDITGSPTDGPRMDLRSNPILPKKNRTFYRNFRTEAFTLPAVGTYGNAGKFPLRGPGINNWDIGVFKNFGLRESANFQFRCEMYNAFNHTQFSAFDTAARFTPAGEQINPRFGQMIAARPPRQIQLAVRFTF